MIFVPLTPAGPRPCVECRGEKAVAVRPTSCTHTGSCPCGMGEEPCPRCEGSGVEACTVCGEPSAIRYLAEDLCEACAPAEEMRFSDCSICDRPIDVRESRLPLCPRCDQTAQAAGQYAADAQRCPDPEERAA